MRIFNFIINMGIVDRMSKKMVVEKVNKTSLNLKRDDSSNQRRQNEPTFSDILRNEMKKNNISDEEIDKVLKKK